MSIASLSEDAERTIIRTASAFADRLALAMPRALSMIAAMTLSRATRRGNPTAWLSTRPGGLQESGVAGASFPRLPPGVKGC